MLHQIKEKSAFVFSYLLYSFIHDTDINEHDTSKPREKKSKRKETYTAAGAAAAGAVAFAAGAAGAGAGRHCFRLVLFGFLEGWFVGMVVCRCVDVGWRRKKDGESGICFIP